MKRISYILFLLLTAACAKELSQEELTVAERHMVFHAMAEEPQTRTVRMADGSIYWSPGDKIRVFHGAFASTFTTDISVNSAEADFTGSFEGDENDGDYYAVYCSGCEEKELTIETVSSLDGQQGTVKYVTVSVPSGQAVPTGSFAPGSFPSTAVATGSDLAFKNICGGAVISVTRSDIRGIDIRGNANERICGVGRYYFQKPDFPFLEPIIDGATSGTCITITPAEGDYFIPGEPYYISMLPGELSKGLTLRFFADRQNGVYTTDKSIVISRSRFGRLLFLDSKAEWDEEAANCYIVKPGESQSFEYRSREVSSSNTLELSLGPQVKVLWESFGMSEAPKTGDVVSSVSITGSTVTVVAGEKEGNAVVAVHKDGEILWSWHIWVTAADIEGLAQTYGNNAGVAMDRNLGALSTVPGDVQAFGLMYQWGRKDPFPGSSKIETGYDNVMAASTITWPDPVKSSSSNGTIEYAVSHPTVMIEYNTGNHDWYYGSTENKRWHPTKGLYDPCPLGWQVPGVSFWTQAMGQSSFTVNTGWDVDKGGADLSSYLGTSSPCWFPATGYLTASASSKKVYIFRVAEEADYWTCDPLSSTSTAACVFTFNSTGLKKYNSLRGLAHPVRCVKSPVLKMGGTEDIVEEVWDY